MYIFGTTEEEVNSFSLKKRRSRNALKTFLVHLDIFQYILHNWIQLLLQSFECASRAPAKMLVAPEEGCLRGGHMSKSYVIKSAYVYLIKKDLSLSTSVAGKLFVLTGVCLNLRHTPLTCDFPATDKLSK